MKPAIIYIMGVSGSGKTTIGKELSVETGFPFFDADDYHPASNKKKMKSGQALTDDDRQTWLVKVNQVAGENSLRSGAIIACSALREKYREVLARDIKIPVYWIFLQGDFELIRERMKSRKDHFMPVSLLQSQFDTLEHPDNALVVDIRKKPAEIAADIVRRLKLL